jgi:GDP-D-mannose 3',5'-epimerase
MKSRATVVVTGAGGFIGHHLVTYLKQQGYRVRGADIKYPEYGKTNADEFEVVDLRRWDNCLQVTRGATEVYALAADMGGMGFIQNHHAEILYNNALMNFHTLEAARCNGVKRYLYTSSACVYPEYRQTETQVIPLKESDAYPRIVRFHNIFGERGTWKGGREKAPAAICRKVAIAKLTGYREIDIWGDGEQTRSFCHVDDCVKGIYKLMRSDFPDPLNLGQDRMVSINQLADMVARIAGISITKRHIDGPLGVRGRNSDNTLLRQVLGWEPEISLEEGLMRTYQWIEDQLVEQGVHEDIETLQAR